MPLLPIAAKEIGVEGIIWVVILIFWSIAQLIQKSRKQSRTSPPRNTPPRHTTPPIDNDVRELLEQLAGRPSSRPMTRQEEEGEEDDDDMPVVVRVPPTPPPRPAYTPTHVRPKVAAHRPTPAPQRLPPIARPLAVEAIRDIHAIVDIAPMLTSEEQLAGQLSVRSGLNAPGLSLQIRGAGLGNTGRLPTLSLSQHNGAPVLNLRDLRASLSLKKAVLSKIILDPPRSLAPYSAHAQH